MSEAYNILSEFGQTFAGLFSWLPPEMQAIVAAAFGVLIGWVVVGLAIKIVGLFL